MFEKVYVDRQPRIGDLIEATSNPLGICDQIVGYEYRIVDLYHGFVVATSDRLPRNKKININDKYYEIVEYREIPEPKEKHVKVYKFLGIPFGKRTTYIYE